MSALAGARRAMGGLSRLSGAQRRLTLLMAMAPVLVWCCSLAAGAEFVAWTLAAVVVLAMATALGPDSHAGLVTVIFLGWYWLSQVPMSAGQPVTLWVLAAGVLMLAFHAATAARATAPGPASLDQAFWRRWLSRVARIAAATGAVWGLAAVMSSAHPAQEALTLAALAALAGCAAYARWALTRGLPKRP